jgi:hypothetical protein
VRAGQVRLPRLIAGIVDALLHQLDDLALVDDVELVKVTAVGNFQIAFEGQVAGPGESLSVPVVVADRWVAAGIASR